MKKKSSILLLLLSIAGFFDSAFLAILHYKNAIPPCTITQGCEKVLTSKFAIINGIPVSVLGGIYFFLLIILCVLLIQENKKWIRQMFLILTMLGTLAAIILLYIQLVILKALCQYCFLVELIIFLLFALSIYINKKRKLNQPNSSSV